MGNSQSGDERRRRRGQGQGQEGQRPSADDQQASSTSASGPSRSASVRVGSAADRRAAPSSPSRTSASSSVEARPRGGGGDGGGGGTSPTLTPVTPPGPAGSGGRRLWRAGRSGTMMAGPVIPPASPIRATASASAVAATTEALSPAREVEQAVLGSEAGIGTELPPMIPTGGAGAASHNMQIDDDIRIPISVEGRTASFRAGDAAAAALAEGGIDATSSSSPDGGNGAGGGYLNQFGQMTSHPSSSLFRGSSNTSLASSSAAPQDLSALHVSSHNYPSSALGTLGELDHRNNGNSDDDEEGEDEPNYDDLAVTPPTSQYYSTNAEDAGLHLSGGDGLNATEREQEQEHLYAMQMHPPDLSADVILEEGEDQEQPSQQQQYQEGQQTQPLSSSGSRRSSLTATRRRSSVRSVASSNTSASVDSATAAQVMQAHPGTTSVGRLRTRRPSAQTRRSSDSGHVLFSWGEDSMSDTSSIGMMQGSTSDLSYQHNMQQQPSQLYSSMNSLDYDQYRHPQDGMNTMAEQSGEEDDDDDDPDIVRGGGRMGSHGGYVVYGNANTNPSNSTAGFTGNYAIGRSQSVQDELQYHHMHQGLRLEPPTTLPVSDASRITGAYATPQDLNRQGMSSSNHFQGNTPIGVGNIQEYSHASIPFVPDPAEPSEFMSRSIETLVLSGSVGPVPILANGSGATCTTAGGASTPASKKRRPRSTSAERQTGRGGGPSQVFTLMSREYSGRLPSVGGGVDRIGGLAHSSSHLAPMEGGLLYPRPSGEIDRRVEEIQLRDEFYANSRGRGGAKDDVNEVENDPTRTRERTSQLNRDRTSAANSHGHRRVDQQQPHANAAGSAPGRPVSLSQNSRLRRLGGKTLFQRIDRPAGGIASEAELLARALDEADWAEVTVIVSRLAPRLIGDPTEQVAARMGGRAGTRGSNEGTGGGDARPPSILDPHNPTYPPHYAGGNRLGLERLTFRQSSGVSLLINVLKNPTFVGLHTVSTNDARNIPSDLINAKLAPTFNEVMACLREMAYAMPDLVALGGEMNEGGRLIPYLFTMLSHDNLFDGAASLIEEMLSLQSQVGGPAGLTAAGISSGHGGGNATDGSASVATTAASSACALGGIFTPHPPPPSLTFSLTQVTDLYELWSSFNPRKLAYFCRILALLVFEPEDRQLMESPSVLKSVELLQLRRDRAARSGGGAAPGGGDGCAVDRNQSIILGDENLIGRLFSLLNVMNYAPDMSRGASAYHVMAHFPWIADTLLMLGLSELDDWDEVSRLDRLSRSGDQLRPSELGSVARMLESLAGPLLNPSTNTDQNNDLAQGLGLGGGNGNGGGGNGNPNATHLGHIIQVINAAQRAGVIVGQRRGRTGGASSTTRQPPSEASAIPASENITDNTSVSIRTVPVENSSPGSAAAARVVVEVQEDRQHEQAQPSPARSSRGGTSHSTGSSSQRERRHLSHEADAANELQFNALLLAPYQVEVLFVLCTLLGGRRKVDAQTLLGRLGLVPLMDDMFERLGWTSTGLQNEGAGASSTTSASSPGNGNGYDEAASAIFGFSNPNQNQDDDNDEEEHAGIHGPGKLIESLFIL